ncbi:hypothetical protein Tco_1444467 [Tanacetum coccineum]
MMVQAQEEMGEGLSNTIDPYHTPTIIQPSTSQPQKKQKSRKPKRKDTEVPQPSGPTINVVDEAVFEELDDSLERAATTATSLDAEKDKGNIDKTQSKATLNEAGFQGTMYKFTTKAGEEVFVVEQSGNVVEEVVDVIDAASTIPVSAAIITDVEITLAQALA